MPQTPFVPRFLDDMPVARRALAYAREMHAGQRRASDHAAYILHPLEVASLLKLRDYDEDVIAAALLHDTIEGTTAGAEDIAILFGDKICRLVAALSENPSIEDYHDRKADLRARITEFGPDAIAIFAADKVAKARELRAEISHHGGRFSETHQQRLEHYEQSLAMLERVAPSHPWTHQLCFELEALRWLPPAPAVDER